MSYSDIPVQEELTLRGVYGRTIDMIVTVRPRSECGYTSFRMKAAAGSQHYTSITYTPLTSTLRVSRDHSGTNRDFVHVRECFVRDRGGEIKLRVILNRFSAEIFVNDGKRKNRKNLPKAVAEKPRGIYTVIILIPNQKHQFATVFFAPCCVSRLGNTQSIPCGVFLA